MSIYSDFTTFFTLIYLKYLPVAPALPVTTDTCPLPLDYSDLHAAAGVLPVVLPLPAGGAAGPGPGPLGGGGQGRGLPRLHNIGTMVTTCHLVTSLTCDLALVLDPELWL